MVAHPARPNVLEQLDGNEPSVGASLLCTRLQASSVRSVACLAGLDQKADPDEQRINFLARRNWYNSGLSLAMSIAAALVISWWQPGAVRSTGGFVIVFAMAMSCGLIGVWLLGLIPAAEVSESLEKSATGRWREPWRSTNFRQLLAGYSVWQFATQWPPHSTLCICSNACTFRFGS